MHLYTVSLFAFRLLPAGAGQPNVEYRHTAGYVIAGGEAQARADVQRHLLPQAFPAGEGWQSADVNLAQVPDEFVSDDVLGASDVRRY